MLKQNKNTVKFIKTKECKSVKIWNSLFLTYVNITKKEALRLFKHTPYCVCNITTDNVGTLFID